MYFGTKTDEKTSFRLLDLYVEAGGSFLDTANCYAFWIDGGTGDESELLLGRWLKERHNRDRIFLATKVGSGPDLAKGPNWPQNKEGLSAKIIEQAIEGSLKRLDTEYIDLYYTHALDKDNPMEETLEAFDNLVKKGKVRYIGASNLPAWRLERAKSISRANKWTEYCCIQQRHTYLRPKYGVEFAAGLQVWANDDLLEYCTENTDVILLAYSPLLSGAYTREDRPLMEEYNTPDTEARMAALKKVANEVGATLNQVILAWMMQGTPTVIPLIAASTQEQLQENLDTLSVTLNQEQLEFLTKTAG
jgi:aryl-alcohol dehydrogenase-like predicted oxidoreductase